LNSWRVKKGAASRELADKRSPPARIFPLHAGGAYQLRRRREAILEREAALRLFVGDRQKGGSKTPMDAYADGCRATSDIDLTSGRQIQEIVRAQRFYSRDLRCNLFVAHHSRGLVRVWRAMLEKVA
jgi:hypothetical protein